MISAIDKKLLRDLGRLLGQVITIALVVAGGIAGYVTMQGTYVSLEHSRATYYERYRFADVFAHAKRVPDAIAARIEAIDGAASVYTRIVESVMVPVATLPEPASGTIVSVLRSLKSKRWTDVLPSALRWKKTWPALPAWRLEISAGWRGRPHRHSLVERSPPRQHACGD